MSEDSPPGLDLTRLAVFLERERPGLVTGPLWAEVIEGGRSNLTYRVRERAADGDGGRRWVLRRPPLGHVLATAHDMAREYRVIGALRDTAVPVPETVLLCEDDTVLGAPFYLMTEAPGSVCRTAGRLAALGPDRTRELLFSLVDTLVALHAVDPDAVGLGDFGRPEGFLERQLRRWAKQLESSRSRELPGIDALQTQLAATVPVSPAPSVLHGGYRLDNVLVGPEGRITAVLDWEMSTLGDPLTDLGLLAMYSAQRELPGSPIAATRGAPGHPEPAELIERYARGSGRDVSRIGWYTAFAYFKLSVICEGIHHRYTLGRTVGPGFERIGALVPLLTDGGLTTLRED